MRKIHRIVSVAAITLLAHGIALPANALAGDDGRTAIVLSASERNAILIEMRGFLESVQGIVAGLAEQNSQAIATSARKSGMASARDVAPALKDKLPTEFKKLGMATHMAFDDLARESMEIGDKQIMLKQLGALMGNCTSCHAGYRIDEEGWRRK